MTARQTMLGRLTLGPLTRAQVWTGGGAITGVATSVWAAPDAHGALGALLALTMLAIAICDARHGIIPNELNAAGFALAMLRAVLVTPDFEAMGMIAAGLRGSVTGLLFLALRIGYRRLRGHNGIGLGDVKLAIVAGALLDWLTIPIVVEIAALAGLAFYGLRQFWLGQPLERTNRLPFGLFFAPAIWLGWLFETVVLLPA